MQTKLGNTSNASVQQNSSVRKASMASASPAAMQTMRARQASDEYSS